MGQRVSVKKDIQIIPAEPGKVTFDVVGAFADTGLALLQRLYVLLLSEHGTQYRSGTSGNALLQFLDGGNIPSDAVMNAVLAISCADAVNALDSEDRAAISTFSATSTNGTIVCTLTLADGATIQGALANV